MQLVVEELQFTPLTMENLADSFKNYINEYKHSPAYTDYQFGSGSNEELTNTAEYPAVSYNKDGTTLVFIPSTVHIDDLYMNYVFAVQNLLLIDDHLMSPSGGSLGIWKKIDITKPAFIHIIKTQCDFCGVKENTIHYVK